MERKVEISGNSADILIEFYDKNKTFFEEMAEDPQDDFTEGLLRALKEVKDAVAGHK